MEIGDRETFQITNPCSPLGGDGASCLNPVNVGRASRASLRQIHKKKIFSNLAAFRTQFHNEEEKNKGETSITSYLLKMKNV